MINLKPALHPLGGRVGGGGSAKRVSVLVMGGRLIDFLFIQAKLGPIMALSYSKRRLFVYLVTSFY